MRVSDLKQNIELNMDALFQAGYDLGWNSLLDELDEISNYEWNHGNTVTAEIIRRITNQVRGDK